MKIEGRGRLLRIYIGEKDRCKGKPLYEAIIRKSKEMGMAGSTVIRGIEGFGAASRVIHKSSILRLSEDLPVLIGIVDREDRINEAIEAFKRMMDETGVGVLMTLEQVEIIRYRAEKK